MATQKRKRTEEALRESENRFTQIAENAQEWIWEVDASGLYTYASPAVETVLGYEPREIVGKKHFYDLFHPEDSDEVKKAAFEVFASKQSFRNFANRNVHKNGSTVWLSRSGVPKLDKQGHLIGYRGVDADTTERRKVEGALQSTHEKLHAVFDAIQDGICAVDTDFNLTDVNEFMLKAFDLPDKETVLGRKCFEMFKHRQDICPYCAVAQSFQTRAPVYRTSSPKDLEITAGRAFEIFAYPIIDKDGRLSGAVEFVRDITESKEAEQNVLESERKFRALFESTNDAVMLLDENEFFECNEATLRIFGCSSRDQFIGKHPSELSPSTQPDETDSRTAARAKIALALKTGRAQFEWLHRRVNGTEFMADVLLSSMELKGKTVLQAVVRDISERKKVEKAVVRERTTLRRLLESSDRDRKLTAYEIHDGFTQHIVSAKMQLEAASQLMNENPEAATQACERSLELLTFGISEARRLISGLRPPILDEAGVVAAIEHLIDDPGMQEGPEISLIFKATFGRLEPLLENAIFRVVQESVTNARRYSQSSKVQVRLTHQDSHLCIEVQDWGIGFDPDDVAEASFGIRGIKERARLLGGWATIDSTPGKGTLVRVELPLVEDV
jgi:PAS domain S-box-containing protein